MHPSSTRTSARQLARTAGGRIDRADRLLDAASRERARRAHRRRRGACTATRRFEPADGAAALIANAQARAGEARSVEEARVAGLELSARDAEQRVRRAARGAEREELLAQLEELAAWYRDLVAVAVGAEEAAIHLDKLAELREDATIERLARCRACSRGGA